MWAHKPKPSLCPQFHIYVYAYIKLSVEQWSGIPNRFFHAFFCHTSDFIFIFPFNCNRTCHHNGNSQTSMDITARAAKDQAVGPTSKAIKSLLICVHHGHNFYFTNFILSYIFINQRPAEK